MEADHNNVTSDVLRSAWKRFAELDKTAMKMTRQHHNLRRSMAVLGVVATLLAVVLEQMSRMALTDTARFMSEMLRFLLIMLPITISVIAAYINKFLGNGEWLTLRAAAEELQKEIYLYRTVLQGHPDRTHWLSHRMTDIMRRVYKSMGGQLVLENYEGPLPPYHDPKNPTSDPGFKDLDGDEYLRYRLINQRDWHRARIRQRQRERQRIQLTILAMGGFGALLAALAGPWVAWVAVSAAIASALTGWEQLRGLDETIMIYSRVILELTIVRDEWESNARETRCRENFTRLVRSAEGVMWAQNQKYVATMQDVLAAAEGDDARVVENMIQSGRNPMDVIQDRMEQSENNILIRQPSPEDSEIDRLLNAQDDNDPHHDAPVTDEFNQPIPESIEGLPSGNNGEAAAMHAMMQQANDEAEAEFQDEIFLDDEMFPDDEIAALMGTLPDSLDDDDDADVDQAIGEVFHPVNGQSRIEEAVSNLVEDDDDEIKG